MTKNFQNFLTTIISSLATLALTLISDFLLNLPNEITWLTFFVGAIVTISATLIEQRLISTTEDEIEKKLEIYKLLGQISDPELLLYGQTAIKECEGKLRNYADGILEDTSHIYMTGRIAKAQRSIQATFWVQNKNAIHNIEDTPAGRNYQSNNRALLDRGVRVERIFIMNKNDVIDKDGRFSDTKALKVMQAQLDDGAEIRISWLDEWGSFAESNDLYRDFGILDEQEIIAHIYGTTTLPIKVQVLKNTEKVKEYTEIFSKIRKLSHPLSEVLMEYPPVES